jgi:hypothetical protein
MQAGRLRYTPALTAAGETLALYSIIIFFPCQRLEILCYNRLIQKGL